MKGKPIVLSTRGKRCFVCKFGPTDGVAVFRDCQWAPGQLGPPVCAKHRNLGFKALDLQRAATIDGLAEGSVR